MSQLKDPKQNKEVLTVTMRVIPADPTHYGDKNGIIYGMLYFLKSNETGQLDPRPYYTSPYTDVEEFRRWFRLKMVYMLISPQDAVLFGYDTPKTQ